MTEVSNPRVLVVIASASRRGAEIEGVELARNLTERGVPTMVVALAPSTSATSVDANVIGAAPLAVNTLRALRRLARQVDVVIAYGSSSLPACSIALVFTGTPFVYRSIGDPARWVRGRVHRMRTALLFHRAKRVVTLWPAAADSVHHLYRYPLARIDVIPNARDDAVFAPPSFEERVAARHALGVPVDAVVVAFVGALTEEKRPELAVAVVASVPGAHLLVAGDGPLRHASEVAGAAVADRIHFLGSLIDVRPVLFAADLMLSTSRTEGMPGSLIEASMCGLPIVATDVGAVEEVVASNGRVVPVDASLVQFAAAIGETLATYGTTSRASSRYHWTEMVEHWRRVTDSFPHRTNRCP